MKIQVVQNKADLKRFINYPFDFYRDDPNWVAPLRLELKNQFNPKTNPLLDHCVYQLFLLIHENIVIGRIAAFVDYLAVDFWQEKIGLFGYYECIQDQEASRMLFDAASDWLREQGMDSMRGPWTFVSEAWGLVVEGFTPPPCIMSPHNPPYYAEQFTAYELNKAKDLLCYYISGEEDYQIPDRILTLTDRVAKRCGITVRPVDMDRYEEEVQIFLDLSNSSIIDNWGYSPVTEAEASTMAKDLKQVIQPKGVLFAEDADGRPIGFAIALPDINVLLKGLNGRLFPFGWLKLLRGIPRLTNYRMFALGVIPEYHGRGIDSLIYRALYESLFSPEIWMEINYVLEDNYHMNNAIHKLLAKPLRRYRIYERDL
ncbi:MAG: GNAT family N-acetyltransferase [Anaerolineales bacterium]|nr:MAG: GNAT family N-acetyltransferase [Anaerolineales bacterium]